jgi:hypothetical protein
MGSNCGKSVKEEAIDEGVIVGETPVVVPLVSAILIV